VKTPIENPDGRIKFIIGFICVVVSLYAIQLFNLQILSKDYKASADSNAFFKKTRYPSRGSLYDRNGDLLVFNQAAYDLMVVIRETQPFDTLSFCKILNITPEQLRKRFADIKNRNLNPGYSSYIPQTFWTQLGQEECGVLLESLYKFPGFYIQNRTVREYNYPYAAHVLGYIAIADKKNIESDTYYTRGDHIGKTGIERSYEHHLRGEKGVEILLRDAHGRVKGKYENGIHDVDPIPGKNLTLSLDIKLQAYAEELLQNKTGSIIMIEPATGEILCMAVSPTYDPSILVGRKFSENYLSLHKDPRKPLLNRAIIGKYPPGSTFKTAQSLVFLEEEIITPNTFYSCYGGFPLNGGRPKCHRHGSPLPLVPALSTSCNAYFCWGMKAMLEKKSKYGDIKKAFDTWKDHMVAQGFGYTLGVDLPGELRGLIPNSKFYDKHLKRWNAFSIISISIGQGEISATPIQICNLAATLANRGYYYVPHAVKGIEGTPLDTLYTNPKRTGIKKEHYETVVEGMAQAVKGGTCRRAAIPNIEVCGKTGTAENVGKDHSIFMGFAPKNNPKVAISVYIENGGFGATYAVPIGKLMIEKYLTGEISDPGTEERMKNAIILPHALSKN